jgi:uncharacterized membrane protein
VIWVLIGAVTAPIAFFMLMCVFSRLKQIKENLYQQDDILNQLQQLCGALRKKLDEQEKAFRLLQLQQQHKPDFTETVTVPETTIIEQTAPQYVVLPEHVESIITASLAEEFTEPRSEQSAEPDRATAVKKPVETFFEPAVFQQISKPQATNAASFVTVNAPHAAAEEEASEITRQFVPPSVTPVYQFTPSDNLETTRSQSTAAQPVVLKTQNSAAQKQDRSPWLSLELLIGLKVMPWVAMGLFVLFATLFIQYAFTQGWITNVHKVAAMGLFSSVLLIAGKFFSLRKMRYFSISLTTAGITIALLAGYSSYGFYSLIRSDAAMVVMSAVVIGAFLLSWHYTSRLLGIMSILCGLAVPILLQSSVDHYNEFFSYLVLLNVGTIVLINLMKRPPIAILAFVGTQVEFWLWYRTSFYVDKLPSVLIFQSAFYLLYLLDTSLAALRPKQRATWDDALRAIVSPILFYALSWYLLEQSLPAFTYRWIGWITFGFAGLYALFALLYSRRLRKIRSRGNKEERQIYWSGGPAAATVMSLSFLALAIPLQFSSNMIGVAWIFSGAALWCIGNRVANRTFVNMSVVFLVLGTGRTAFDLLFSRNDFSREILLRPLCNDYALPIFCAGVMMCMACVFVDSVLKNLKAPFLDKQKEWLQLSEEKRRRFSPLYRFIHDNLFNEWKIRADFNVRLGDTGLLMIVIILSVETFEFFRMRPDDFFKPALQGMYALTVLWTLIGFIVLFTAFLRQSFRLRMIAFLCFAVTVAKIFCGDILSRLTLGLNVIPIGNSCSLVIFGVSIALLTLPAIANYFHYHQLKNNPSDTVSDSRNISQIFAACGGLTLFIVASMECWYYFVKYPLPSDIIVAAEQNEVTTYFFARASLSVLWGIVACAVLITGIKRHNQIVRYAGLGILTLTAMKILGGEIHPRPEYVLTCINPYFLTILIPCLVAVFFAVWITRIRPSESQQERDSFCCAGIIGLLFLIISSSQEIWYVTLLQSSTLESLFHFESNDENLYFLSRTALTAFGTVWGIVLFAIGMTQRSLVLRIFAALIFIVTAGGILAMQLFQRPHVIQTTLANPYFLPILFSTVTIMFSAVWGTRLKPVAHKNERRFLTAIGIGALAILWGALTVECFAYFRIHTELNKIFVANAAVTIFWTTFAVLLALLARAAQSKVLHYVSLSLTVITLLKVLPYELPSRPGDFGTLLNPFMIAMAFLSLVLMTQAVVAVRIQPVKNTAERQILFALGMIGLTLLWIALSDECFVYFRQRFAGNPLFIAYSSLTAFWTIFAVILLLIAQSFDSKSLRIASVVLLCVTFFKAIPLELLKRPGDLSPLFNPFMPTLLLLSSAMIAIGIYAAGRTRNDSPNAGWRSLISTERLMGQTLAFAGLALLFVSASIECHESIRSQLGTDQAAWLAQTSISILWSVFGGILIFIGFVWRSASLRWVAIALLAVTACKVITRDMAGFDHVYRIIAIFILAVVLMVAAWAYQSFKARIQK